ncbi:MAG: metal-sensitive transcriptional regulator, partial [Vulcanimicrobiaceae bacterium]
MARKSREPAAQNEGKLDLDPETTRAILARLRRVEGQVRAIARMIEQWRDCHAVAQQMGAAKAALERATVQLMASSLVRCIRPNKDGEF